jgi:hypothetical protein
MMFFGAFSTQNRSAIAAAAAVKGDEFATDNFKQMSTKQSNKFTALQDFYGWESEAYPKFQYL